MGQQKGGVREKAARVGVGLGMLLAVFVSVPREHVWRLLVAVRSVFSNV